MRGTACRVNYRAAARAASALALASSNFFAVQQLRLRRPWLLLRPWPWRQLLPRPASSPLNAPAMALPATVPTTAPAGGGGHGAHHARACGAGGCHGRCLRQRLAVAVGGLAAAVGAAGVAGLAGALLMAAGRTDLPPPMRLAWASEGAAKAAIVTAITEAVVRKDVFTRGS